MRLSCACAVSTGLRKGQRSFFRCGLVRMLINFMANLQKGSTIPWTGPGFWTGLDSGLDSWIMAQFCT